MKRRALMLAVLTAVILVTFGSSAAPQRGVQLCNWGGTPAAPTGQVTIPDGLRVTPLDDAIDFSATGALTGGGRCKGTMTFTGIIEAGSTCATQVFDGTVRGLPDVARFHGPGAAGVVHEFLYDHQGNVVGADQPLLQIPQPDGYSHAQDCATPEGFTRAVFSSTVELWG